MLLNVSFLQVDTPAGFNLFWKIFFSLCTAVPQPCLLTRHLSPTCCFCVPESWKQRDLQLLLTAAAAALAPPRLPQGLRRHLRCPPAACSCGDDVSSPSICVSVSLSGWKKWSRSRWACWISFLQDSLLPCMQPDPRNLLWVVFASRRCSCPTGIKSSDRRSFSMPTGPSCGSSPSPCPRPVELWLARRWAAC